MTAEELLATLNRHGWTPATVGQIATLVAERTAQAVEAARAEERKRMGCKGSLALGTGCGSCDACDIERARTSQYGPPLADQRELAAVAAENAAKVIDLDSRRGPHYRLALEFDCTDEEAPAFVRGYEAGMLSARLDGVGHASPPWWLGTYHTSNAEMLRRIAASCGYAVEITESEDPAWIFAEFRRET